MQYKYTIIWVALNLSGLFHTVPFNKAHQVNTLGPGHFDVWTSVLNDPVTITFFHSWFFWLTVFLLFIFSSPLSPPHLSLSLYQSLLPSDSLLHILGTTHTHASMQGGFGAPRTRCQSPVRLPGQFARLPNVSYQCAPRCQEPSL